jgi:cytochrome c-type biogenesis protein
MFEISFAGAALAGLLSFASPCILPMVSFYLSYLAGLSMSELQDEGGIAPGARKRLIFASMAFAVGVTTIFVLLGLGPRRLARHLHSIKMSFPMLGRRFYCCLGCISSA